MGQYLFWYAGPAVMDVNKNPGVHNICTNNYAVSSATGLYPVSQQMEKGRTQVLAVPMTVGCIGERGKRQINLFIYGFLPDHFYGFR